MFTGIVEQQGVIAALERGAEGGRLRVRVPQLAAQLAIAGSIAVNGCCLTVVERDAETFAADLSGETLRRTSFGELGEGTSVNLEWPLTAGKEFGGHFVQGHVDGVGRVTRLAEEGANWWLGVRVPEELARYVAMKGSIALDGISLTVAGWREGIMEVAIIPFTYQHTNVGRMRLGDAVNVECDILAKYVERMLAGKNERPAERLTVERLIEQGW
ncbi:MAG TPA: riboflavin synthase [Candidatus Acidoferrales bacterium]|nr:riboflavin synthase [Candidatus Acidoferrales bacterium]